MSTAFRCDICGDCVDDADNAKSLREVARETGIINEKEVDIFIRIGVDVAHVCDTCWMIVMQKVKQWVQAHI